MRVTVFIGKAGFDCIVNIMNIFKHNESAHNFRVILVVYVGLNLMFDFLDTLLIFVLDGVEMVSVHRILGVGATWGPFRLHCN